MCQYNLQLQFVIHDLEELSTGQLICPLYPQEVQVPKYMCRPRLSRLRSGASVGSDLVLCMGGGVPLSVPLLQSLEGFLIDGEIFSFSNGYDFNQDLLVQDAVPATDRFLGGVEFVVAGEVKACSVPEMFAEPRGGFEFSELLGNWFLQRPVELPKIIRRCSGQDHAIPQAVAPSATA